MSEFLDAITKSRCRIHRQRHLAPPPAPTVVWEGDEVEAEVNAHAAQMNLCCETRYGIDIQFRLRQYVTDERACDSQIDIEEIVFQKFKHEIHDKLYGKLLEKISEMENNIISNCSPLMAPWYCKQFDELRKECEC